MVAKKEGNNTETYAQSTFLSLLRAGRLSRSREPSCKPAVGPCAPAVLEPLLTIAFPASNHSGLALSVWVRFWKPSLACRVRKHLPH